MPKGIALFDRVNYTVPGPSHKPEDRPFRTATKGQEVDTDTDELDRLVKLGAVSRDTTLDVRPDDPGYSRGANPVEEVVLSAGIALKDGSPGPNASTREAVLASARRELADRVARGDLGGSVSLTTPEAGTVDAPTGDGALAPVASATDDELDAMKVEELLAYLTQHSDDVDRVEAANARRKSPSKQVTDAIEKVRTAAQEAEDERVLAERTAAEAAGTGAAPTA